MAENSENTNPREMAVVADPKKMIPKFATKVTLSRTSTGSSIIMTFLGGLSEEQPVVIERIAIETKLAEDVIRLIKEVLEVDKNESKSRA